MDNIISRLKAVLTLDNEKFKKGLKESEKQTKNFGSLMGKLGGAIAGAFAIKQVIDFGVEISKLSREIDVVERAFSQFGDEEYLNELRNSTGHVITDLELMKRALNAIDLGLSKNKLPEYFKFAAIRSAETGQSVDYLINAILGGIGRQSKVVFDNLSISQKALRDEIKKTGDYTIAANNLIQDQLSKTKNKIEDVTSGVDQLSTSWSNFINEISKHGGVLDKVFKLISSDLNSLVTILNIYNRKSNIIIEANKELNKYLTNLKKVRQLRDKNLFYVGNKEDLDDYNQMIKKISNDLSVLNTKLKKNKKDLNDVNQLFSGSSQPAGKTRIETISYKNKLLNEERLLKLKIDILEHTKNILENTTVPDFKKLLEGIKIPDKNIKKTIGLIDDLKLKIKTTLEDIGAARSKDEISELNLKLKDLKKQLADLQSLPNVKLGLIEQLNKDIKDTLEKINTSKSRDEIGKLNLKLKELQRQLAELKSLPGEKINTGFDTLGLDTINLGLKTTITLLSEIGLKAGFAAAGFLSFGKAIKQISKETQNLNRVLSDTAAQGIASVGRMIGEMIGGNTENALKNFIDTIANLLEGFGTLLISFGVSLEVFQKSMNPYAMIAAGVALVAIGAAMSTSLSKISSAAGGSGYSGSGGSSYGSSNYDYNREIVMVARGNDLVAVINKTQQKQSGLGGI